MKKINKTLIGSFLALSLSNIAYAAPSPSSSVFNPISENIENGVFFIPPYNKEKDITITYTTYSLWCVNNKVKISTSHSTNLIPEKLDKDHQFPITIENMVDFSLSCKDAKFVLDSDYTIGEYFKSNIEKLN